VHPAHPTLAGHCPQAGAATGSHPEGTGLRWGLSLGSKRSWGGLGTEDLTSFFGSKKGQAKAWRRNSIQ